MFITFSLNFVGEDDFGTYWTHLDQSTLGHDCNFWFPSFLLTQVEYSGSPFELLFCFFDSGLKMMRFLLSSFAIRRLLILFHVLVTM